MKLDSGAGPGPAQKLTLYERGYVKLRTGMATLAGSFPVIFLASSWVLRRTEMQPTLSNYYFTRATERNLFVGILITVAVFLVLYEGYSTLEDRVSTLAGVLAAGVALVPMGTITWTFAGKVLSLHGTFAVLFFCCIDFICIVLSKTTLADLPTDQQTFYRKRYALFSSFMIGSVLVAFLADILPKPWLFDLFDGTLVFWVEAVGVWSFGLFWYYKTREVNPAMPWRPFAARPKMPSRHEAIR